MPPRYYGWDESAVRAPTLVDNSHFSNGCPEQNGLAPTYRIPTFTPIKRTLPDPLEQKSSSKGPSRGIDSDSLYDIPLDDSPLPICPPPKKRRVRSTIPARNKIAPATHTKQTSHKDNGSLSQKFAYISTLEEQKVSRPSSKLNSTKATTTRRTSSALSKQTKVFPNSGIIKPNTQQSYDNDTHFKHNTEFTINTPSTLDKVANAGHNGLAKTTLEKLAAFRYKSTGVAEALDQSTPLAALIHPSFEANISVDEQGVINDGNGTYSNPGVEVFRAAVGHEVHETISDQTSHFQTAPAEYDEVFDDLFHVFETANSICPLEFSGRGNSCGDVYNDMPSGRCPNTVEFNTSMNRDPAIGTEISVVRNNGAVFQDWEDGLDDDDFAQFNVHYTDLPDQISDSQRLSLNTPAHFSIGQRNDDFDDGVSDSSFMKIVAECESSYNDIRHQVPISTNNNKSSPRFENEDSSHLPSISNSTEDEYSMDDVDEIELANLVDQVDPVIIETHSPPTSWTQFDVRSRDIEVYDETLNRSSPSITSTSKHDPYDRNIINMNQSHGQSNIDTLIEPEDWSFLNQTENSKNFHYEFLPTTPPIPLRVSRPHSANDDSHEYLPLTPFARAPFPTKTCGKSLIPGLTACSILRTCFRVGECLRAGSLCSRLNQDALIELFCRVTFSSRETGTHKQYFQFEDLFHSGPPFVAGALENYLTSTIQERESRELLTGIRGKPEMVRCLGRLRRQVRGTGWLLHLENIRKTDWEEVRWTRRIVGVQETKKCPG